jgi:hypothetical protein
MNHQTSPRPVADRFTRSCAEVVAKAVDHTDVVQDILTLMAGRLATARKAEAQERKLGGVPDAQHAFLAGEAMEAWNAFQAVKAVVFEAALTPR